MLSSRQTQIRRMTPHVTILGTPYRQKWEAILLENCRRFAAGQPLLNVVDKEKWY